MDHPVRNGDGVELRLVDCDISEDELFRGSRHPLDVAPALPAVRYLELWNRLVFWLQFEEGGRPGVVEVDDVGEEELGVGGESVQEPLDLSVRPVADPSVDGIRVLEPPDFGVIHAA